MIGIQTNQIYTYCFDARFFVMNVFFLKRIDFAGLGPSVYHFKVVVIAAFVAPCIIHQVFYWFMLFVHRI